MSRAEKPVCGFNDSNFPAPFGGQRFQLHALLREELRNLRCSENSRRPLPRPWRDCLLIEKALARMSRVLAGGDSSCAAFVEEE